MNFKWSSNILLQKLVSLALAQKAKTNARRRMPCVRIVCVNVSTTITIVVQMMNVSQVCRQHFLRNNSFYHTPFSLVNSLYLAINEDGYVKLTYTNMKLLIDISSFCQSNYTTTTTTILTFWFLKVQYIKLAYKRTNSISYISIKQKLPLHLIVRKARTKFA